MTDREDELRAFVVMIARMNYDGERKSDGTDFELATDDAFETVHALVNAARALNFRFFSWPLT